MQAVLPSRACGLQPLDRRIIPRQHPMGMTGPAVVESVHVVVSGRVAECARRSVSELDTGASSQAA